MATVADTDPSKTDTTVAILGYLCDNVGDLDDAETPTNTTVSKDTTIGVEESHGARVGWGNTSSPAPTASFCNPPPYTRWGGSRR